MSPIARIRNDVFGMTQAAFAEVAGVSQPTVWRWEKGECEPSRDDLERIRAAAMSAGKQWDDRWFFEDAQPQRAAS